MSDMSQGPKLSDLPSALARAKRRWAPQIIWIIPIIAILVGLGLAYKAVVDHGPTITVAFKSGDGLIAGKTFVKYKEVNIGLVKTVVLSEDHQQVIATIKLDKDAADFARDDTRFWIVRPRITASGVSGLSTLLDGPFIAADLGKSASKGDHFVALEVPPILTDGNPGREFILRAPTLGSHGIGTPVYFRRLNVGQVVAYDLDKDGKNISIRVFIDAPYDQYVTNNTRFWNASGIDVSIGATGIQLQTESLVAVVAGGIAFEAPHSTEDHTDRITNHPGQADVTDSSRTTSTLTERAKEDAAFTLFQTRVLAMKQPDTRIQRFVLNFKESVRGLSVGAPVEFRGVNVGEVVSINTAMDPQTYEVIQPVEIFLYPDRLKIRSLKTGGILPPPVNEVERLKALIKKGFRAQMRTASYLTGQQYIAIDFFTDAPKYTFNASLYPPELPVVPSALEDAEKTVANVLKNSDRLMKKLDTELVPELNKTLKNLNAVTASDSPLQTDMRDSLREIAKAASSMKTLTDMLDQQPQSLIFGKPAEAVKK
ncbi:intermembrane transport protein PqiB [Polynucleobacter sp. MG-27-Goln-C1]|uniref:PqiB family protein n=1 Tax=Polynucleobacter sp. MG-27-Goln-C1 TaxID=1819726 RepID=UPI001C0C3C36|nr:MlaD family protein [Polynucleobacter sp. MG-27-Goln-C1]MBU3612147.1 MCE family protein [Polynucleobacter sp. MG-27-Goln-C1]